MDSDFAIVTLPPGLSAALGAERVLIEALAMYGTAALRGVYTTWDVRSTGFVGTVAVSVTQAQESALEALFVAAHGLAASNDVSTVRDADVANTRAKREGRYVVRHTRPFAVRRGDCR